MIGVGLSLPQVAVRRVAAAASGPTVILLADYTTDALLNLSNNPVEAGLDFVGTWPTSPGGSFTNALAVAAGATGDAPVWEPASGVQTAGEMAALTCATPVTIPADTDCVIYLKCVLAGYGDIILGCSTSGAYIVFGGTAGWAIVNASAAGTFCYGEPTDATFLARARRTSGVWTFAWTGQAELAADGGGSLANAAITLDTLLAQGNGATLNGFSPTGQYLQKAYIYHGSSSPDTTYETANGGVLS